MAEQEEEGAPSGAQPDTGGLAQEMALAGASRAKADAFLEDQRGLIAVQKHHLHEQFKQLRLSTLSQRLTIALKLATGLVGFGVIAGLGLAVWNASEARGLVVESFAVPPKFAEAGVTGAVLSEDVNSRLGVISNLSDAASLTRSSEVSINHDDEFRVEIPETGVSLGQAWRFLRLWFGHERRLTGNLRELPDGKIALTATLAGAEAFTVTGLAADLDRLEQQAAEHVFQQTDPLNYAIYLGQVNRRDEIMAAALRALELAKSDKARADAFSYLATATRSNLGDFVLSTLRAQAAISTDPTMMPAWREWAYNLMLLGHDEEALQKLAVMARQKEADQSPNIQGRGYRSLMATAVQFRLLESGDFAAAASLECPQCVLALLKLRQAEYAARAHDPAQGRSRLAELTAMSQAANITSTNTAIVPGVGDLNRAQYYLHAAMGDWNAAAADARANAAYFDSRNMKAGALPVSHSWAFPLVAVAEARGGDLARAKADADAMPQDCYACLRAHGVIAGLERNWANADAWFARAVTAAPSIPFAYEEWGRSLLDRGKPDEAIARFTLAVQESPHFADALEGWGEALMAKNQSHLALKKFAEAEKYAPSWGRLHLKWGEALFYAGKKDEAAKQFARAAQFDLTPSEKAELARHP